MGLKTVSTDFDHTAGVPGELEIAVIGMAGAFPGARNLDQYWAVVRDGRRTIDVEPAGTGTRVRAGGVLDEAGLFDAEFFGYSPREAERLDPQQRAFLECAWTALEDAGYGGRGHGAAIGVYAGASLSTYLLGHLLPNAPSAGDWGDLLLGNSPDMLATRVAYHLDLKGPAITVQTACSTSLVAVHLACQALLANDCDMAVAGGVSIRLPQMTAHGGAEGGVLSPDGLCLPFDAGAAGTVDGNGVGAVVLKPLVAAMADRDAIRAVIKATALNNDGRDKVGFVAPSIQGQSAAIRLAHALAGIDPATIGYVETHGTATVLGDPIEFAALAEAFGEAKGPCTLGSVKALIGHLDAAAGIASLIKTVLALQHRVLPPSPYFTSPNPAIDLDGSPFQLTTTAQEWPCDGWPRRAGISSFGMGGTNAHVILEEAPPAAERPMDPAPREHQLILISARTPAALGRARAGLRQHLAGQADDLPDVAYTLQCGRASLPHRLAMVCVSRAEAVRSLADEAPGVMITERHPGGRAVVFMFSGQGSQYPAMGAGLYRAEPAYRSAFDECAEVLVPHLGLDIRDVMLKAADPGKAAERLQRTGLAQPALFAVEYALAHMWTDWGIRPAAMIGHSIGEFAAACRSGTMSLGDAAAVVAERGRLMQSLPPGRMLSVSLPIEEAARFASGGVAVAADNGPAFTVLSGPPEEMAEVERRLTAEGVPVRRLHTSHAFHSAAMDPVLVRFRAFVSQVPLNPPAIPFVSNVTGDWISDDEATSPAYWADHLRKRVRFREGLRTLAETGSLVLLELGPGDTLATLARQGLPGERHVVASSLPKPGAGTSDDRVAAETLARLWVTGTEPDWAGYWPGPRRRIPLPTYPFERRRYWVDPPARSPATASASSAAGNAPSAAGNADDADVTMPAAGPAGPELPAHPRPVLAVPFASPRDAQEESIAAVWRELLGMAEIGVHDNFFELGGHSLLATKITARLIELLGVEISPGALLDAPTIAGLSAHVSSLSQEAVAGPGEDDALVTVILAELETADPATISTLLDAEADSAGRPAPRAEQQTRPSEHRNP